MACAIDRRQRGGCAGTGRWSPRPACRTGSRPAPFTAASPRWMHWHWRVRSASCHARARAVAMAAALRREGRNERATRCRGCRGIWQAPPADLPIAVVQELIALRGGPGEVMRRGGPADPVITRPWCGAWRAGWSPRGPAAAGSPAGRRCLARSSIWPPQRRHVACIRAGCGGNLVCLHNRPGKAVARAEGGSDGEQPDHVPCLPCVHGPRRRCQMRASRGSHLPVHHELD